MKGIYRHPETGIIHGVVSIPSNFQPFNKPGAPVVGAHLMDWHGEFYEVTSADPVKLKNLTTGREFNSESRILKGLSGFFDDAEKVMLYASLTVAARVGLHFMNGKSVYEVTQIHDAFPIMAFRNVENDKHFSATTRILAFCPSW